MVLELFGGLLERVKKILTEKKNRRLALLLILLFFYLSGLLAQFLNNRHNWTPGKELRLPSVNPLKGIAMLFTPFGVQAMLGVLCFSILGVSLYFLFQEDRGHLRYDAKRKFYYSTRGTYGTAGWMDEKDLKKCFDLLPEDHALSAKETILAVKDGMLITRKADSQLNRHVAVWGASGTKKSRTYVRNAIISSARKGESMVVTDPKAELVSDTMMYLKDNGYTVKVLNVVKPKESDRYYALEGALEDPIMVSHVVEAIITNTGGKTGDHFFDAAEGNLLSALIFLKIEQGKINGLLPTLGGAYNVLLETKDLNELADKFNCLSKGSRALMAFNLFRKASENVQGNVIIGLGSRLSVLQNKEIAELTSYPDMNLTLLGKEKCAYFLVVSDQSSAMRFISAMFFSMLFVHLVQFADTECPGGRLPVPVNLILDELCNTVGVINDFHIKMSSVRSRMINITVVFQGIGQLQNRYPDNLWSEILGNCDTQIFLGCGDTISAELISERTGEVSVGVSTIMKQRNAFMPRSLQPNYREADGIGRRKLLTMDEVMRMEPEKLLIFLRGEQVLQADKYDYTRNPESRLFRPVHIEGCMRSEQVHEAVSPQEPPPQEVKEKKPKNTRTSKQPVRDDAQMSLWNTSVQSKGEVVVKGIENMDAAGSEAHEVVEAAERPTL